MNAEVLKENVQVGTWQYPAKHIVTWHTHATGQLAYPALGVARLVTHSARYLLSPSLAAWIPRGIEHSVEAPRTLSMCTAYIPDKMASGLPKDVRTFGISPLIRELLLALSDQRSNHPVNINCMPLFLSCLSTMQPMPAVLPWPRDARLRRIADALSKNPAITLGLCDFARQVGCSRRTLIRLFPKETGLTFADWRKQLRFLHAIELLAAGGSVTTAALDVGYSSPSAFIAEFRRQFGETPRAMLMKLKFRIDTFKSASKH